MDPVTIALTLLMKHPATAAAGVQEAAKPAVVDVAKMQSSFADLSKEVLLCYHKSARFRSADKLQHSRTWAAPNTWKCGTMQERM